MADRKTNQAQPKHDANKKDMAHWKPGSESAEAKDVAAKGDFGVPAGAGPSRDRDYVSHNTKASDPGNAHPADWDRIRLKDAMQRADHCLVFAQVAGA